MKDDKDRRDDDIEYLPEDESAEDRGPEAQTETPAPAPEAGGTESKEKDREPAGPETQSALRPLKDRLRKREAEVKHLKKEMEDLRDQCLRRMADTDNLRKRLEREKAEYYQFATSELLLELLSVLDNLERALQNSGEGDGKTLRDGVELIYRMTWSLLQRKGVQPIEIKDAKFDPNLHHAMAMEESEAVEEPEVTEVLQKGYMLHNRLLRPSLVKVVVPKKKDA